MTTLDAALICAKRGFKVFPAYVKIINGKKDVKPCGPWRQIATDNAKIITDWFDAARGRFPDASLCIATGESGLVVVDGDGEEGVRNLRALDLPQTWIVRTPGGGEHHYYRADPARPVRNSASKIAPNVDIRGDGGFTFAPPSADARGVYMTIEDGPESLPIVPQSVSGSTGPAVPKEDVFELPGKPQHDGVWPAEQAWKRAKGWLDKVSEAPDGAVNDTLSRASYFVGKFVGGGLWAPEQAEAGLMGALHKNPVHDIADDPRMLKTVRSQLTAGAQHPYAVKPNPPDPAAAEAAGGDPSVAHEAAVQRELWNLRARTEAREQFDAERHAKTWTPPDSFGSLTDELALPDVAAQWRIKGLLGAGHNAVLVAGRKAGKTTMVNELVRSLVDGEPFLGRFDVEPIDGTVAIFNYELDPAQYRRWLREVGILNAAHVHVLHLRGRTLPLKDARVRAWVTRWLRERDVRTWVVDPYSRAYVGSLDDGNAEAQVGAFLDTLDVIKQDAGVSELVMPVHTPKARAEAGEETAIGSQRLEGWPDALWYLTRDLMTGLRFLRAEGRDIDVAEEKLTYEGRRLKLGGWDRATTVKRASAEAVATHVSSHPGCSQNDIQTALDLNPRNAKAAVQEAVKQRLIRIEAGARGSHLHYPIGTVGVSE